MYSKFWKKVIKTSKILIILGFCFYVAISSKVEKVNSLENIVETEMKQNIVAYNVEEINDPALPFMEKKVVQKGVKGVNLTYNDIDITLQNPVNEIVLVGTKVLSTFYGELTGYGPDCIGCGGTTACRPGQNLKNGNIYFDDVVYGKINILAADSKFPCGSIIRITTDKLDKPVLGIVLDRGGAIKGNIIDLLYEKESSAIHRTYNVKYDLIRNGW